VAKAPAVEESIDDEFDDEQPERDSSGAASRVGAVGSVVRDRFSDFWDGIRSGDRSQVGAIFGGLGVLLLVWGFIAADIKPARVVVIGLQSGAVYSLVALGIALVYKATRVLNFGQGELGTAPAFVAYALLVGFNWSDTGPNPDSGKLWWATLVAIAFGAGFAVLVNVAVVQRLAKASPVTALVATAGVSLLFISAEVVMFEAKVRPFPRYIEGDAFTVSGVRVTWHTVIVLLVLGAAASALAIFFRTPAGVALLAMAQEPFAAELSGVSVRAMSVLAWGTAGALAAVAGLLGAGVFGQVRPGLMTTQYLIYAFAGAVVGGLNSMPGAVVGSLILGLATVYANELVLGMGWDIPGPPQIAMLLLLLLVLMLRPRGLLGKEA